MLKPFLLTSAAILFLVAAVPATGVMQQETAPAAAAPASTNPVRPTAASQERAKGLYARDCALCHGESGNGKTDVAASMSVTLDDWTQAKALSAKSDQELFNTIRKGKGDKMPSEEGRARVDEVWNLVTYIRAMSKAQPAAAPPPPEAAPPRPEAAPAQPEAAPPPPAAAPAQPTN
jgi:mono/diheme cytochrome c family protein